MILITTKRFSQSAVSRLIYFSSFEKHSFSYIAVNEHVQFYYTIETNDNLCVYRLRDQNSLEKEKKDLSST